MKDSCSIAGHIMLLYYNSKLFNSERDGSVTGDLPSIPHGRSEDSAFATG